MADPAVSRDHPAEEVYVTGTFDDWKKTEKLEKVGEHFEKLVRLGDASKKIFYKVRGLYLLFVPRASYRHLVSRTPYTHIPPSFPPQAYTPCYAPTRFPAGFFRGSMAWRIALRVAGRPCTLDFP